MTHLYNIFHCYDEDGGFSDAVPQKEFVGLVEATEEEIVDFLTKWDRERIYDRPYNDLREHKIVAEIVKIAELSDLKPYPEDEIDWPGLPEGLYTPGVRYNTETNQWEEENWDDNGYPFWTPVSEAA